MISLGNNYNVSVNIGVSVTFCHDLLSGCDVIAQAQSGTGKTATFSVAILQNIVMSVKKCQALVLAPTRELAQQVSGEVFQIIDIPYFRDGGHCVRNMLFP